MAFWRIRRKVKSFPSQGKDYRFESGIRHFADVSLIGKAEDCYFFSNRIMRCAGSNPVICVLMGIVHFCKTKSGILKKRACHFDEIEEIFAVFVS